MEKFAVIDTETNWDNEVMSIGAVIAKVNSFEICELKYYILNPEHLKGGIYSDALRMELKYECDTIECDRRQAISDLLDCLKRNGINKIFAYNASFDYRHLPELSSFVWHDIMRLAAYRQYNHKIKEDCCSTGRLKRNYGVAEIKKMLTGLDGESHNALLDAIDELISIMTPLGYAITDYIPYSAKNQTIKQRNNNHFSQTSLPDLRGIKMKYDFQLSQEQSNFIAEAKKGNNILVDACIGSGKTTAIQYLCNDLSSDFNILYLTYNRLLKIDAKAKIRKRNVTVNNYHGFAYSALYNVGITTGIHDLIQAFIHEKPPIAKYDILILDEYQDIEQELAEMLEYIKSVNPTMQIIAVGDMEQKIYDKTTLNVPQFIHAFLDEYLTLKFTVCFRLSAKIAAKLGRIWKKDIVGVNNNCIVEEMDIGSVTDFLSQQTPEDILCLGSRIGGLATTLNLLEKRYPDKFNKNTVYASISDSDDGLGAIYPTKKSAIFTTFDSSKGLERKICVVFDFTESYWGMRTQLPLQSYEILRNIFCVAASRGKEHIIFVKSDKEALLSEKTLSTKFKTNLDFGIIDISSMFDFKYKENIEHSFSLLHTQKISIVDVAEISIKNHDCLIDLSPCVGIYQEAVYFNKYDIDKQIEHFISSRPSLKNKYDLKTIKKLSLDEKILFLTSLETNQERYRTQVEIPFVNDEDKLRIIKRLNTILDPNENTQIGCSIEFSNQAGGKIMLVALGLADVVKNNVVYELKFVSELSHEHFLQCACYMIALNLETGILWNTRKNEIYGIRIPNKKLFMDSVTTAITNGIYDRYIEPKKVSSPHKEQTIKKNIGILYFSSTGNSLYLAQKVQAELGGKILYIPSYSGDGSEFEHIILVTPIHSFGLPTPVFDLLPRLNRHTVLTVIQNYGGIKGGADRLFYEYALQNGLNIHSVYAMKMPENYTLVMSPPAFYRNSVLKKADGRIAAILNKIKSGIHTLPKRKNTHEKTYYKNKGNWHLIGKRLSVIADRCIQCEKCVTLCPAKNIALREGKIEFADRCIACLGCFHRCPQKAIIYNGKDNKKRYVNPMVDESLIGQNIES